MACGVGVTVRGLRGCPRDALSAIRRAARAITAVSPARHRVRVTVAPHEGIELPGTGAVVTGMFGRRVAERSVVIRIAAGAVRLMADNGVSRTEAVRWLVQVFAHEYCHYEDFRDGRPLRERGVNVRSFGLMRRAGLVPPRKPAGAFDYGRMEVRPS
jgi:hypothetical protein